MLKMHDTRELAGPSAQGLADITSELTDIKFARAAVEVLLTGWAPTAVGPNTVEAEALWIASVVAYSRCFGTGVRTSRTAEALLGTLSPLDQACHEYLMDLRDRHIVHSVNAFEKSQVGVVLGPAPTLEPQFITPTQVRQQLPGRVVVEDFGRLLNDLETAVSSRFHELGAMLLEEVQAMTPAQRASLPQMFVSTIDPVTDPKVRRTQIKGSRKN